MPDSLSVGVVMDPIESIKIVKDSTFAMLLEAQRRNHRLIYMNPADLRWAENAPWASARPLSVKDDPDGWYELGPREDLRLGSLDVLLMRKDPPFNMEYIYDTYLLEQAQREGTLVVNDPQALRDANEKMFTAWFPDCCPPTLVARDMKALAGFVDRAGKTVLKPLGTMGGQSIFVTAPDDPNLNVILETLTAEGQQAAMAQRFIPEISAGDKRILLIDGEPVPYALARIPQGRDFRGNLAKGGRGEAVPLSDRDRWIAQQVGPVCRERGMLFVGLDVIGDWLTEINVTSPTCIRELDAAHGLNIAGDLFNCIEAKLEDVQG